MAFLQEYTMLDELGKGGFATVYKVRHNDLGYIRAIRVLNETIVDSNSPTWQKFLRECKVLLRLGNGNHPNIVHIYQPRLLDNKALVEMDYVDGQDILHYLNQNQNFVPVEEVLHMAMQMSSALAYCHENIYKFCMDRDMDNLQDDPNDGSKVLIDPQTRKRLIEKYKVIHNDIHSGNIMRREDGNFVLLDFGLAINGGEVVRSSRRKNGAPEFKAPEKWDNEAILTEQSDIYSFGIVLYQYLAGRVPFPFNTKNPNSTEEEYLLSKAHQNAIPSDIEGIRKEFFEKKFKGKKYTKDYPQWLEDVILKCMQKNPNDRFKNGKELHQFVAENVYKKVNADEIPQDIFMKSVIGHVRKTQADSYGMKLKTPNGNVFVVCDGMGKAKASSLAVESIIEYLNAERYPNPLTALDSALQFANMQILRFAVDNPEYKGMGTTACIVLLQSDEAYIAHVGDSRIYLYLGKEKALYRLTKNHSYVQTLVDACKITEEAAKYHPYKNCILKMLGVAPSLQPSFNKVKPKNGDVFMICSNGLYEMLSDSTIEKVLGQESSLEGRGELLIRLALEGETMQPGGQDNCTLELIQIDNSPWKKSEFISYDRTL